MENINWSELGFSYMKTNGNVRCEYHNGSWGNLEWHTNEYINMHMAATALHYGQEIFEGLKAYRTEDGRIVTFRPDLNAERMVDSAKRLEMPTFPVDRFVEAVEQVVAANADFVPPYGSGATMYLRPYMFGSNPVIGVKPATEYQFRIFVTPVGPYFKGGFSTNPYVIIREYDRSAPLGTGIYKVGGNYASSMLSCQEVLPFSLWSLPRWVFRWLWRE